MRWFTLAVVALLTTDAYAGSGDYTKEDLRILAKQKSWRELAKHLGDIRPSQRDAEWQSWLERSATGSLKALSAAGKNHEALAQAQELLVTYPSLSDSESFRYSFTQQLVEQAQPCVSYRFEACVQNYANLMQQISLDGELSYREGLKVYQSVSKALAVPFFASAVTLNPEYCQDSQVAYSLLYTLDLPKHSQFPLAQQTALSACGQTPLPRFEDHIIESKSVRSALCPHYLENGFVTGIIKKICEQPS